MKEAYKNCQSCGMPLKKDPQGGGTNEHGNISKIYCSHCYKDGKFTAPNITALQMQTFVKDKLKEIGFSRFIAYLFTLGIPKLERWKTK